MNRWWTAAISAGLFGLLVWAVNFAVDVRHFPIRAVKVEGPLQHLSSAQVQEAVTGYLHESFFRVDLDGIRDALLALPWVANASVRRQWPDRIRLVLTERRPVAIWGERALVDEDGAVFEPDGEADVQGLPVLEGPDGSAQLLLRNYRHFHEWLDPLGDTVVRVVMDSRRAWRLQLGTGAWVLLGRQAIPERLGRYVRSIGAIRRQNPAQMASRVDLRYPNGLAIQWADSPEVRGE